MLGSTRLMSSAMQHSLHIWPGLTLAAMLSVLGLLCMLRRMDRRLAAPGRYSGEIEDVMTEELRNENC